MPKVILKAFGKINLTLDVLGQRDDGYHSLETVFRGIHIFDLVTVEKKDRGIHLECDEEELPSGPENLAWQAAELLRADFPAISGVNIKINKRIPIAAGLAGGSTDAAAVLLGLNRLFRLGLSRERLAAYAGVLGSDVPFCLYPLAALGRGRGEILEELPEGPEMWLVLVKPPFGLSTGEIFGHLSQVPRGRRPDLAAALRAMEEEDFPGLCAAMENALEVSAFDLQPKLAEWKQDLSARENAGRVMMTGSGPTLVAFFDREEDARRLAAQWNQPRWDVLLSKTLTRQELERRFILTEETEEERGE